MSLTQASSKLIATLEAFLGVIKQERLIVSEEDVSARRKECLSLAEDIESTLAIEEHALMEKIEKILDVTARCCSKLPVDASAEGSLAKPKTVLLTHKNKAFVLSKNIPRPQIDFKDKEGKYSVTRQEKADSSIGLSARALSHADLQRAYCTLEKEECCTPHGCCIVSTKEELEQVNALIEKEAVVGVDVKMHTFRSYRGFVCFLQVATSKCVYVFDVLALRKHTEMLSFLSSAQVLKVFYNLPKKAYWIKKDMGISVVQGIDLAALDKDARSLNASIRAHLGLVQAQVYTLVDWRLRDITAEMQKQMENEVQHLVPLSVALVRGMSLEKFAEQLSVLEEYVPLVSTPESFSLRYGVPLTQKVVDVFSLRDFIAKQEDESPAFVLTNRQMQMFLSASPKTPEETFALFPRISSLFKANLTNFLRVLHTHTKPKPFNMAQLTSE
ncbi:exosome complex exonuclease RRP6 [Nematocida sp. AWRm77]|nr:exosome complex exonuclease RRP6 [Nematocida sp. AWRm77]